MTVECVEHRIVSDHRQDDLIERLTKIARSFLGDGSVLCFILARFILEWGYTSIFYAEVKSLFPL